MILSCVDRLGEPVAMGWFPSYEAVPDATTG